ncbi:MAG: hypothetical protein KDE24_34400 [Caldilinea sp.]|nr:hypothetical protein [Caldilinea sp.]
MTTDTLTLIAFALYLIFFGWLGYRRGVWPELTLLLVTAVSWVLLQERGSIVVRMTNFFGKFLVLIRSGGLTGSTEDALQAVSDAPNVITDENQYGFLFLVWAVIVLFTFILTTNTKIVRRGKHGFVAVLLGLANGLVFAALLIPVLSRVFETMPAEQAEAAPLNALYVLVTKLWEMFATTVQNLWQWMEPLVPSSVWLIVITLLLIAIAWPVRRSAKR